MPKPLKDIHGIRFGLLTAVSHVSGERGCVWLFLCDCGNSVVRHKHNLNNAENKSNCGCLGRPWATRHWATTVWLKARHSSARRGRPFNMTVERFGELMSQPCHYCGGAPSTPQCSQPKSAHRNGLRNGIDRVNSSLGYVEGNCVPCCCKCNRMKLDHSVTDFLDHVSAIHNHQTLCVPNIIHIKHHAPPLIHPNSLVHAGGVAPLRSAAAGS